MTGPGDAPPFAVVFDCEFLAVEGSPSRFWCGPQDPDPIPVQVGAIRIYPAGDVALGATFSALIAPADRHGQPVGIDPFLTGLTGITADRMAAEGRPLGEVLAALAAFAGGAPLWSWGRDDLNLMAIGPWIAGIPAPIPATRFGNATGLLLQAGVPLGDIQRLRSHTLAAYFDLPQPAGRAHDALHDATAVASVVAHLIRTGRLSPAALVPP